MIGTYVRLSGIASTIGGSISTDARSLSQNIEELPARDNWSMQRHENEDDGVELAKAIMQGSAIASSDGAFGTTAWVIQGADEKGEAGGWNIAPGYP